MSVKVEDNTSSIQITTNRNVSLAIRYMLDAIDEAAFPKTPKRRGELRKDIFKQVLGLQGTITWKENYAVFQEAKQFRNYTTPGTGPHFAENAVKQVMQSTITYFKKAGVI